VAGVNLTRSGFGRVQAQRVGPDRCMLSNRKCVRVKFFGQRRVLLLSSQI